MEGRTGETKLAIGDVGIVSGTCGGGRDSSGGMGVAGCVGTGEFVIEEKRSVTGPG
jgi:hypothetical protein